MLEFADDLARPLAHAVLTVLRIVWWLTWELWLDAVTWYIGWPVCRALSFGRVPSVGIGERDEAGGFMEFVVHVVGAVVLVGTIALLARYVHG